MTSIADDLRAHMRSENVQLCSRPHKYVSWVILISYLLFLTFQDLYRGGDDKVAGTLVRGFQDWPQIVSWIRWLVLRVCCEFVCFAPIGFTAVIVFGRRMSWLPWFPVNLPGLAIGGALTALVCAVRMVSPGHQSAVVTPIFPVLGCVFGAWAGAAWLRGRRSRLWFIPKVALLAALILSFVGVTVWLSLEEAPLPFDPVRVTSTERRRLVDLVNGRSPDSLEDGQMYTVSLTEYDVNVLLAWGLSSASSERKAKVSLDRDSASLWMSVPAPLGQGRSRYLNLRITGGVEVEDGVLTLHVSRCRISFLRVPGWLLDSLCPVFASFVNHNARLRPFLDGIAQMTIEPDSIGLTYGRTDRPAGSRHGRFGSVVASNELLVSTRAQVNCLLLLAIVRQPFDPQLNFDLCVKTVFALAHDRSTEGNPVTENQAAILALGMLIGHPRIEEFLGPIVAHGENDRARQALRHVVVYGRSDWARHFCVSAAIAILTNETISDAAGLLKEELDADVGGSGFSFADLLADQAGRTFALSATRDDAAACTMQDRLAWGFRIEEILPPIDDLPEGISHAKLQLGYGGVGGEGYRRLVDEIERRIAACAAYQ